MKAPPADSLRLAALWLRSNDGDEKAQLGPVAEWLEDQANRADHSRPPAYSPAQYRRIVYLVSAGNAAARKGDVRDRDELAAELFRRFRFVVLPDGRTVETWWDRSSRNWITQTNDPKGCQIGSADYTGEQTGAAFAHLIALGKAFAEVAG